MQVYPTFPTLITRNRPPLPELARIQRRCASARTRRSPPICTPCTISLTDELVRFSNPAADTLVRNALASAIIERIDIDFIDPAKAEVAQVSPASVTNGVTAIPSTGNPEADVEALFEAFLKANLSPRWCISVCFYFGC